MISLDTVKLNYKDFGLIVYAILYTNLRIFQIEFHKKKTPFPYKHETAFLPKTAKFYHKEN